MKKPMQKTDYDRPPEVTPEYLEMLRRRWQTRIAQIDFKGLVTEALKDAA